MAAHKDRLIEAAHLLNMTPDDLLTALDRDAQRREAIALHLPTDVGDDEDVVLCRHDGPIKVDSYGQFCVLCGAAR